MATLFPRALWCIPNLFRSLCDWRVCCSDNTTCQERYTLCTPQPTQLVEHVSHVTGRQPLPDSIRRHCGSTQQARDSDQLTHLLIRKYQAVMEANFQLGHISDISGPAGLGKDKYTSTRIWRLPGAIQYPSQTCLTRSIASFSNTRSLTTVSCR